MKLYFAPVQGHTDAPYRHFHAKRYGNDVIYTTPFIRLEEGKIRKKDLKDLASRLNKDHYVIPQIIFRDAEELRVLTQFLHEAGHNMIDLNMGCPFPLQTARGRGAATIGNPECHKAVKDIIESNPDISFSIKMRLGRKDEEWKGLITTLNDIKLEHIAVHPRLEKDQYSPDSINMEAFAKIYEGSSNPLVYNGDLHTPDDIKNIITDFPNLKGIMIGRGLLARPSLFAEYENGENWPDEKRRSEMLAFHRDLLNFYRTELIGGEHQVLSKIQPFWEYAEDEIGRKAWKAIKKSSTMAKYQSALALI